MFRKMRRSNQQVSDEVCRNILRTEKRGVLSVVGDDGYPYGVPINFTYEESENTVYFHGSKTGHKIDGIKNSDKVCFTVMDGGYQEEGDWAWYVTSVIAFGRAELVTDMKVAEDQVRKLGLRYCPYPEAVEEEIRRAMNSVQLIALHIEHMTGKKIHEK